MYTKIWLALLVPFVALAQDAPPEPRCDIPTTGTEVCAYGPGQPLTVEAILLCLDTLELTPEQMGLQKLNNLNFVSMLLSAGYSFGDLVRDSADSPGVELSEGYTEAPIDWHPYNQSVTWMNDLAAVAENDGTNMFDYTNKVFEVLRSFNDAHTELQMFTDVYPFILAWPYNLGTRVAADGVTQELYFTPNRAGGLTSDGYNSIIRTCSFEGYEVVSDEAIVDKTIVTINGVSALEHFRTMASWLGSTKSPGAQFNSLVINNGGNVIELMRVPNFRENVNSTTWNVEWDDGTTASIKPFVYMTGNTTTERIIELGTNPRSEFDKAVITVYDREFTALDETDDPSNDEEDLTDLTPDEVEEAIVNNTRRSMLETSRSIKQIVAHELARHRRQAIAANAIDDLIDIITDPSAMPSEDASDAESEEAELFNPFATDDTSVGPESTEGVSDRQTIDGNDITMETDMESETETGQIESDSRETGPVESGSEEVKIENTVSPVETPESQVATEEAPMESPEAVESEPMGSDSSPETGPESLSGIIIDVDFAPKSNTPSDHVLVLQTGLGAVYNYSGTPIIKYPSFSNDQMTYEEFEAASMSLFEYVSANFDGQNNKLIIDLSSNGGGYIDVMYNFVYALMSQTLDRRLCPSLDIRQSELVTAWVNMTLEPPEKLGEVNDEEAELFVEILTIALNFVLETAPTKVYDILTTFEDLVATGRVSRLIDQDAFAVVLNDTSTLLDLNPTDRAIFINTFRETLLASLTDYIPSILWLGLPPISTELGYSPVGSDEAPESGILPTDFWITYANNYTRGGLESMYSQKYTSCTLAMKNYSTENLGEYGEIVLLTDGNCGSACGQFMNTLQSISTGAYPDLPALNVTTVSWGGFVGEELSINAFEGGNVLKDTEFLTDLYTNGFLMAPLYLVGEDFETQLEKYGTFLDVLPLPYNNGMTNSFNFRESYVQTAGNDSLPSEFYSKPAMFHRNEWYYELGLYTEPANLYSASIDALYTDLVNGDYGTPAENK